MNKKTAACFFLIVFQAAQICIAGEVLLKPSINSMLEFNNNISFSRNNIKRDFILKAEPGLELIYNSEKVHMETDIKYNIYRYKDFSSLDSNYYALDFGSRFSLSERASLTADFLIKNDESLESELAETGIITELNDRRTGSLSVGFRYLISESIDTNFKASYSKVEYDSISRVDYESNNISMSISKKLNNRVDTIFVQQYYSDQRSSINEVDSFGLFTGWSHQFSETLSFSGYIGARRTKTDYFYYSEENWGGLANISLKKTGVTWGSGITLNRELKYSSSGAPVETDKLNLNFQKRIYDDLRYRVSGSINKAKSSGYMTQRDTRYYSISNSIEYSLNTDVIIIFAYSYSLYDDLMPVEDRTVDRNIFRIHLRFDLPLLK